MTQKVVQSTDLAHAEKQIASGDNDTAFKVMSTFRKLGVLFFFVFVLNIFFSRDKVSLGLYKIEMIKDMKVVVSRYESKKIPREEKVPMLKVLSDADYKFVLNRWMFDSKEEYVVGGFIVVDSYNFNSDDRNIHYYPPGDFEVARHWWEVFRHYKDLQ